MPAALQRILIYGRPRSGLAEFAHVVDTLCQILQTHKRDIYLEVSTAALLNASPFPTLPLDGIQQKIDLVIVIGGDGNLLHAARAAADANVAVVGINRGRLGFLTDILPNDLANKIPAILNGNYYEEQRFLLQAQPRSAQNSGTALNDVVLLAGEINHMIEFEIFIDNLPVCSQRADGLIVATPTGSTAYALSGGGPILHPQLDAIVLVPMFAHTLSSRPIVVAANSVIDIVIDKNNQGSPRLSCDSQTLLHVHAAEVIRIHKKAEPLRLIHPIDYNYYETLRSKLKWESKH